VLTATDHHCWHLLSGTIKTNHFNFSCFSHGRIYHSECITVTVWQLYSCYVSLEISILSTKHWKYFILKLSHMVYVHFLLSTENVVTQIWVLFGQIQWIWLPIYKKVKSNFINFYQNKPYRKSVHNYRSLFRYTSLCETFF
jgi:hypothetical protein